MFVVGGSYKRFYINELNKVKNIDLLIFHENIFYDFDYEQEYLGNAVVTNELISLNNKLKCPIVVFGNYKLLKERKKCFIICINGRVSVLNSFDDIYLYIKGKAVLIGNKIYKTSNAFSTVSIIDNGDNYHIITKNSQHNYFICTKKAVMRLQQGRIYRKFQKCCYFTLCFYKKML